MGTTKERLAWTRLAGLFADLMVESADEVRRMYEEYGATDEERAEFLNGVYDAVVRGMDKNM